MHNIRKKKLKAKNKTKLLLYTLIIFSLYAVRMHLLIHRGDQYNEVMRLDPGSLPHLGKYIRAKGPKNLWGIEQNSSRI